MAQVRPHGGAASWLEAIGTPFRTALGDRACPLRYALVAAQPPDPSGTVKATVEASVVRWADGAPYSSRLETTELYAPRRKTTPRADFAVVQVVPTGLRCELGGYAGDAGPATNLLASVADHVITHPNAVNASELNELRDNVLYVEGKSLDDFMLGHLGLHLTVPVPRIVSSSNGPRPDTPR